MTARLAALAVFFGDDCVGTVHDRSPLSFEYTAEWLSRAQPWSLAAVALRAGEQSGAAIDAFFENLLPEGELRQYLAEQRHASTLFALLLALAGDTAGGFVIVPSGERPPAPRYEVTSWQALAERLAVAAAEGHVTIDAHPQAEHPAARQGVAFRGQRDDRHADGGALRTAHRQSVL